MIRANFNTLHYNEFRLAISLLHADEIVFQEFTPEGSPIVVEVRASSKTGGIELVWSGNPPTTFGQDFPKAVKADTVGDGA